MHVSRSIPERKTMYNSSIDTEALLEAARKGRKEALAGLPVTRSAYGQRRHHFVNLTEREVANVFRQANYRAAMRPQLEARAQTISSLLRPPMRQSNPIAKGYARLTKCILPNRAPSSSDTPIKSGSTYYIGTKA